MGFLENWGGREREIGRDADERDERDVFILINLHLLEQRKGRGEYIVIIKYVCGQHC